MNYENVNGQHICLINQFQLNVSLPFMGLTIYSFDINGFWQGLLVIYLFIAQIKKSKNVITTVRLVSERVCKCRTKNIPENFLKKYQKI